MLLVTVMLLKTGWKAAGWELAMPPPLPLVTLPEIVELVIVPVPVDV